MVKYLLMSKIGEALVTLQRIFQGNLWPFLGDVEQPSDPLGSLPPDIVARSLRVKLEAGQVPLELIEDMTRALAGLE